MLVPVFLDLFLDQSWIRNVMFSLSQNRHQEVFVLFFYLRDILPVKPSCTSIKTPPGPVWSTAPIFGVVLHNRVTLISRGRGWRTALSSTLQHLSHRRVVESLQIGLQVLPWEMFPETVITGSPWTLECKINARACTNMLMIFPGVREISTRTAFSHAL